MATPDYWAEPVYDRHRMRVFSPTLDATVAEDDPVRVIDEVLESLDWSNWEACYQRKRGQPPIHPRYIAAAILYGLYRGIRSSRRLEEACRYRLDFMWLVNGHHIDHTTFSRFRTKFREELKQLFLQIGRTAIELGLACLGRVGFDGTRVKANNSRFRTRTAKTLEEKLRALDELFDKLWSQMNATDAEQAGEGSPTQLPPELADLQSRRERIDQALEKAKAADTARRRKGVDPAKNPAQVPVTDPDSLVMPNKEGGYAPNYTPVVTTEEQNGFILDADVLAEVNESPAAVAAVDRIEATFGTKPEQFLTDAGNNSGQVMLEMEQRGVEFYAPVGTGEAEPGHAAYRDDPTQPVPESSQEELPRNGHGLLDKSCFVYDLEQDLYYCPMGRKLPFERTKLARRGDQMVQLRMYRCADCAGCAMQGDCVSSNNQSGRTITRDPYEEVRKRTAARMASESGRAVYKERPRIAETPFAILKHIMGLRQFLLRGLGKVKTEWLWACTAFNLMKLVRGIVTLRAEQRQMAAEPVR